MTRYRELIDRVAEETDAEAVVLIIVGGAQGSGVVVKIAAPTTAEAFASVPELAEFMHTTANQLVADAQAERRSNGN